VPNSSPEKLKRQQEKRIFLACENFNFLSRIACSQLVVRESRHRRDRISDKKSRKGRQKMDLRFFSKVGVRIPFSMGNFHFFGRGKTNFFGGGYNFKTG